MPDIKEKLAAQGMDPFFAGPDQYATLIKAELVKFANIIKTANVKIEN